MALWQGKSRRKKSGGRFRRYRKKRKFEIGTETQHAVIGEQRMKKYRIKGGGQKIRVRSADFANVLDPNTNRVKHVKIITVKSNPANAHYVQRNIITKGATIQTELGIARITSRPGQDGVVNAVLIK